MDFQSSQNELDNSNICQLSTALSLYPVTCLAQGNKILLYSVHLGFSCDAVWVSKHKICTNGTRASKKWHTPLHGGNVFTIRSDLESLKASSCKLSRYIFSWRPLEADWWGRKKPTSHQSRLQTDGVVTCQHVSYIWHLSGALITFCADSVKIQPLFLLQSTHSSCGLLSGPRYPHPTGLAAQHDHFIS